MHLALRRVNGGLRVHADGCLPHQALFAKYGFPLTPGTESLSGIFLTTIVDELKATIRSSMVRLVFEHPEFVASPKVQLPLPTFAMFMGL